MNAGIEGMHVVDLAMIFYDTSLVGVMQHILKLGITRARHMKSDIAMSLPHFLRSLHILHDTLFPQDSRNEEELSALRVGIREHLIALEAHAGAGKHLIWPVIQLSVFKEFKVGGILEKHTLRPIYGILVEEIHYLVEPTLSLGER